VRLDRNCGAIAACERHSGPYTILLSSQTAGRVILTPSEPRPIFGLIAPIANHRDDGGFAFM
jgi:hypothetical protein